jgi:hypothetical protein
MEKLRISIMEMFKAMKNRPNEKGEVFAPQTSMLLTHGGGWKGIGYSLIATSPEMVSDNVWGKKRIVLASQGPEAIADFDAWFNAGIGQGFVPVWRYYISHKRCIMDNSEFKNTIVHRRDTKNGSILVEFVPGDFSAKVDMKLFAEVLSDEMNVKGAAEESLSMSEIIGRGAKVLWTYSGDRNAA